MNAYIPKVSNAYQPHALRTVHQWCYRRAAVPIPVGYFQGLEILKEAGGIIKGCEWVRTGRCLENDSSEYSETPVQKTPHPVPKGN